VPGGGFSFFSSPKGFFDDEEEKLRALKSALSVPSLRGILFAEEFAEDGKPLLHKGKIKNSSANRLC
jgi:roadblock/LC7 domain-containing protein